MSEAETYMLRWRGRESGPFGLQEINRRLDEHEIGTGHEIFYQDKWTTVGEFLADLDRALNPPPPLPPIRPILSPQTVRVNLPPPRPKAAPVVQPAPPKPPPEKPAPAGPRPRHRLLFAFLAILAGFVGAHNFYARQWLTGLLQLLLSVATFLMGFGIIASWLWAMAEAVFVRKDGDGLEMI